MTADSVAETNDKGGRGGEAKSEKRPDSFSISFIYTVKNFLLIDHRVGRHGGDVEVLKEIMTSLGK